MDLPDALKDRAGEFVGCSYPKVADGRGDTYTRPAGSGEDRFGDSGEINLFHVWMGT